MSAVIERCPRCAGPLLRQDEQLAEGRWVSLPTCLHCSYQVFNRPSMTLAEIKADLDRQDASRRNSKRTVRA